MKKEIHPEYNYIVFRDEGADFQFLTRSTLKTDKTIKWEDGNEYPVVRFDLSSASHAFYTGKDQQINDRGGRIQQFRDRYEKQAEEASDASAESDTSSEEVAEQTADS